MNTVTISRLRILSVVAIGLIVLASILSVSAASTLTRTVALRAGWNAVYLDVRPPDPTAETVLAGLPSNVSGVTRPDSLRSTSIRDVNVWIRLENPVAGFTNEGSEKLTIHRGYGPKDRPTGATREHGPVDRLAQPGEPLKRRLRHSRE